MIDAIIIIRKTAPSIHFPEKDLEGAYVQGFANSVNKYTLPAFAPNVNMMEL